MMMAELLDYYDSEMRKLGIAGRDEVHRHGWWHVTFHCWIIQSQGRILFQQRSRHKAEHAGLLDITAAGHLQSGESDVDGLRELEEEIGVKADMDLLVRLGIRIHTSMPGNKKDHEFAHEFLLVDDRPMENYILQPTEVQGLYAAGISEAKDFFSGNRNRLVCPGVRLRDDGELKTEEIIAQPGDFVTRIGPYYLLVCLMAERMLAGERILAI